MSPAFLFGVAVAPFLIFFVHAGVCRLGGSRVAVSPQLSLIRLVLFLNLPLLMALAGFFMFRPQAFPWARAVYTFLFVGIVFNSWGYAYFHLFNLSETSQRVRLLILLRQGRWRTAGSESYSLNEMVDARIKRLVQLRQIRIDAAGRCTIANRFFLTVAYVLRAWRQWFRFDRETLA